MTAENQPQANETHTPPRPQGGWQFWVDRGGTFTDIIVRSPSGNLHAHKFLSVDPARYDDAVSFAVRTLLADGTGTALDDTAPLPAGLVDAVKVGTTVATNALLERNGAKTLLLTTEGFGDALLIGQQHRDDLFALSPTRPAPLYEAVAEIPERMGAGGETVIPLDEAACRDALEAARADGMTAVAIVFVHGYRFPDHEARAADIAVKAGFTQVSVSHRVSPTIKFVPRGDTAVADAYLSPVLKHYVSGLERALDGAPLSFMMSNGGLAAPAALSGKDAVLSGPAGGLIGAADMGRRAGCDRLIAFDMGGTSTDVSHYDGRLERVSDTRVAGARLTVPMVDIHTVAAGGGSLCRIMDGRLIVGPASAGAMPGPASYGRGGPLAVTDCNVLTGKLQPDLFPNLFGREGNAALNPEAARTAVLPYASQTGQPPEAVAEGFLAVAVEHMARAIRRVTVARGRNVRDYGLLVFGGAGGQHACLVADRLGMTRAIVPPFAGMLSALGIGLAPRTVVHEQTLICPLSDTTGLSRAKTDMMRRLGEKLTAQGLDPAGAACRLLARIKVDGTDTPLDIGVDTPDRMAATFRQTHQERFGFIAAGPLIIDSLLGEMTVPSEATHFRLSASGTETAPFDTRRVFMDGTWHDCGFYDRSRLNPGHAIHGPAILVEDGSTTVVEPGWTATRTDDDMILLDRTVAKQSETSGRAAPHTAPDPVLLEVFNNRFMAIAEEMGGVLAQTAHSVNVKERLDFSCAVFDAAGNLIANAPHMPVHLGSMGDSVAAILRAFAGRMTPGDSFVLNDPYEGGTHLPDVTIVSPVFLGDDDGRPDFFVASRGHHADIGGLTPGSMPPFSTRIDEEGVRIPPSPLVRQGRFLEREIRARLREGPYPARQVNQNIADLKAQVAANARGAALLQALIDEFGLQTTRAYMGHVQENAAEAVRGVLDRLRDGRLRYAVDGDITIAVTLTVDRKKRRVCVDFTGTSPAGPHNFNAPLSVTRAAVLYVFRVLTGYDIPMNAGCLIPIDLVVPDGCLLNPAPPAAVVAGNVETSQAVTNALLLAADASAAAQGTMNNLTFGTDAFQYYETVAGGTGAGPDFDGADAIQSHMTNSRLTDVEILETRYPVRVTRFGVRADSGGGGHRHGGNGAVRQIMALRPMHMAILSSHRQVAPPGLNGGAPGLPGRTVILRADGSRRTLAASDSTDLDPGDTICLETPGGGGYGKA
ncbi:hydantoinase B/oxoprolinase family protein [Eilatimonas milleporae]|uniref:5-oxoprolinase (ATP-hydrolysing) n=1 Tax=Eilatimonas milleporae TaxID=911205 RepID=A0A3M0CR63_9PROT|nr:hydantoinase B/oxoprolinase family protein [Eilatimonas milleporae]RMB12041.1 5-oxoprolinase (ATP-hydrolysing) [Eilatimonas milleporae]